MDELVVGDPGAAVDRRRPGDRRAVARRSSTNTPRAWTREAKLIKQSRSSAPAPSTARSSRRARTRSRRIELLTHEVFGPALHVVRWKADELDEVIDAINATGYGLTLGVHSRIDETDRAHREAREGRQLLRQPQPDRRGGRRAAVRRREPVRHRPEGRRAALPAALRHREDVDDQYDGGGRQCVAADAGRMSLSRLLARAATYDASRRAASRSSRSALLIPPPGDNAGS